MKIKITVDFDDSGEEHDTLQGIDVEFDFKEGVDMSRTVEHVVAYLWSLT